MTEREQDVLSLHRNHLIHCGTPYKRAMGVTSFPTTRYDLQDYYEKILDGKITKPNWANTNLKDESDGE